MIITKTPLRVSLLGGGTDYKNWFWQHGGLVVGGAINRFSYIHARYLPPYHPFKHRLMYREIETVDSVDQIRHGAIRAVLYKLGMDAKGVEIAHLSDMPARSGTGSSSTFVVGLLHALLALQGLQAIPDELAEQAIAIEQDVLNEVVGCQDQWFAARGGLNIIRFHPGGEAVVHPLGLTAEQADELENHLMLFFTRIQRTSSEVAATYVSSLGQRSEAQFAMMKLAEDGIAAIYQKKWERLGHLIDQSWRIKSGLSEAVTNNEINRMYAAARLAGAWGGKITGAGGGGCLLLVAPPERHPKIRETLANLVEVSFRFHETGSQLIFASRS